jgi:hypothetical protein
VQPPDASAARSARDGVASPRREGGDLRFADPAHRGESEQSPPIEGENELERFDGKLRIERRCVATFAVSHVEHVPGRERAQAFPERCASDAELTGKIPLDRQALAGAVPPIADHLERETCHDLRACPAGVRKQEGER